MKLYITNKTLSKLREMIENQKSDSISVRKYKKGKDSPDNLVSVKMKLTEKQRESHKSGKSYTIYINKDRIKEVKKYMEENNIDIKTGGIIPLIPAILAGIAAVSGLTGAATGVAKTIIDKKHNDAKLEEEKRYNDEMIKAAKGDGCSQEIKSADGLYMNPWKHGMGIGVKEFINGSDLDEVGKKTLRNIIKNLSEHFKIERQGNGLFLQPFTN